MEIGDAAKQPLTPGTPGMVQGMGATDGGAMQRDGACKPERNGNISCAAKSRWKMQQRNRMAAVVFSGVWQHYILLRWVFRGNLHVMGESLWVAGAG